MANLTTQYYLNPEEQEALLGGGGLIQGDETAPLSPEETAAVRQGLGDLPVVPLPKNEIPTVSQVIKSPQPPAAAAQPASEPEAPPPPPAAAAPPPKPPAPRPVPQAPVIAQTKGTEGKIVRTGPEWYDYAEPPKINGYVPAALQLGSGILQALIAPKKAGTAARVALGLGGAVDAASTLAAAPQADYQNRLEAAKTQADMHTKLNSGGRDDSLGWANLQLQQEKFRAAQEKAASDAQYAQALRDPNSPESREIQRMAVLNGQYDTTTAMTLPGEQILKWRPTQAQDVQRGWSGSEYDRRLQARGREWDRQREAEEERKIEGENRERDYGLEAIAVPGYEYRGKRAPNNQAVNDVRQIVDSSNMAILSARKLQELQDKVSTFAQLTPRWLQGTLSPEEQHTIAQMRTWAINLDSAQRNLAHFGVPQQFEMAIIREVNPDPTGLQAFLKGKQAWKAQADVLTELADHRLATAYDYHRTGPTGVTAGPAPDKPFTEKVGLAGDSAKKSVKKAGETAKQVAGEVSEAAAPVAEQIKIQIKRADGSLSPVKILKDNAAWQEFLRRVEEAGKKGQKIEFQRVQ